MGADLVIDRRREGYRFWKDENTQDQKEWRRFGARIRELTGGRDVDIVFEHPGRETFGASVFVAKRGGTIVTCASTSGYMHQYDNRYLWMNLKRIVGSHFANYAEAWAANDLISRGLIHPTLSRTYSLDQASQAAFDVHRNLHQGKVGVLCLAPGKVSASGMSRRGSGIARRSCVSETCRAARAVREVQEWPASRARRDSRSSCVGTTAPRSTSASRRWNQPLRDARARVEEVDARALKLSGRC
jgi:NAD(P)-dependent dehydrogenase (short-subunit alcohol dehydrogenase family)